MSKLIIGCGYLGRYVAKSWLRNGDHVAALTRSASHAHELASMGIDPFIGDVCSPESLKSLPSARVVLFAVGYDRSSGRSQREVYVDGLKNVLDQVAPHCHQFIYISSSSVYGQSDGEWVDESSITEPVQPGGQCCLAAEQLIREFSCEAKNLQSLHCFNILRLSGIYGPGRLLSRVESLRAGEPLSGRGDAWLNLIHVDDAAAAVTACEGHRKPGETYLVTDDRPIRREEYYGQLARLVSAPPPKFDDGEPSRRGSGGLNKRCSNRKLHNELLVQLRYPTIGEGLPQALDFNLTSMSPAVLPANSPRRPVE